ncbi:MAG: pyridoxal-phosphate dependent enzyme [Anaerolineae bacterium]|nr:pyridoxal-phosphate dependent enzyme [Anaerolineae bacterium]
MPTLFSQVVCLTCGHQMLPDPMIAKCERCGGAWLDARYHYGEVRWANGMAGRPLSLWRYEELLPLSDPTQRVTIGEGMTPIIRAERLGEVLGHEHILIKDERRMPTNSFKDRQGALSVSILKQAGVKECVLASTGNAAAAYAAYCARAGIKLWVFLPSMVPAEKMRELGLYGAELIKVTGTYDQTKKVAADFAARRNLYFDRGSKGIPGKESMKTLAFEIAEQLGIEHGVVGRWVAPDWYIQAVSGGIGPLGVYKGFLELYQIGLIDKVPKLGIVQVEGCAPMVRAFERGLAQAEPVVPETLITVLATGDPSYAYTMLYEAIQRHGGAMVSVDDGQAFRAMRRVARTEGFSVEPATAVAFAGLEKLIATGAIQPHERVLLNCSGHTFSAEKHILEDQYVLELELGTAAPSQQTEGLGAALERLDEQITTVVVIDDNPHDTRLIRRLLQARKNYRVFESNNPIDGLDLIRQRRPDLVITDLTMPEMDGFSLLETLKADPETAHIPVIVLSGKALTAADKARLSGQIDSVWLKGDYSTRELVDHVVSKLKERAAESEMVNSAEPQRAAEPTQFVEGPFKVLIVDDNPYDARLVRRILEASRKFSVTEARTGESALKAMQEQPPDLVILDVMLPDMGGLDVLQRMRQLDQLRNVRVAVMSAKELGEIDRARLLDAVFWQKATLDRKRLVEAVEAQIKQPRSP